ncbi:L-type lectin-domain containing receptor kinase SIT1-like [Phragmites australis]|uniref:L-type lectin-domain containing receptor kinase SIT1-like n=1 Tax=Phragmites australis TaxID=29695 RepID=UPI002D777001|nr:L-type lectin-domain containing receptor kinase SIT1-like [Phragmites australis]
MFDMKPMSLVLRLMILFFSLKLAAITTGSDHFVFSGFSNSDINLDGAATVLPNGLLYLTNGTAMIRGHAFYPTPLRFREFSNSTVHSFSVSFVFGILPPYPSHGIAFFVAPSKNFSSAVAVQYMGLLNKQSNGNVTNHIFAVELDPVQNSEFHDINDNHVGIDINSLQSMQSYSAGFYDGKNGNFENLSLISGAAMQVWVDYNAKTSEINVTMAPLHVEKPVRPLLSATYNLSTLITELAYVGFSSSTGKIKSQNYVLGWSFGMNSPAPAIDVTKLPRLPHVSTKDRSKILEISVPMAIAMVLIATGTTIFLLVQRHLRYAELREDWEFEYGPHRFLYKDLFDATQGFRDKHLVGSGGFGTVYKGVLRVSKLEIAVKRVLHSSQQGMKEFIMEIVSLGRLQHRNLVQLLGYCRRKGELFLVYDYMPNGSLDKYLYSQENNLYLGWAQRFHIIKGIASALLYLHEEWEKVVIHRDIKPSNVLLDNEMNARLGDFGLARLHDHNIEPQSTQVVGTIGYLAPELASISKATPHTDVFSFGIFILEVTCGKKPIIESNQENQLMLVDWVLEHWHKGSLTDTVDTRLEDEEQFENLQTKCLKSLSSKLEEASVLEYSDPSF